MRLIFLALAISLLLGGCRNDQSDPLSGQISASNQTSQTPDSEGGAGAKVKTIPPLPGQPLVPTKVTPPPIGPDIVIFNSPQGKVTFRHADHAGRLACSLCHPNDPPEKFAIDETFAHNTCKGCHKNSGAGPTACKDCHGR
jgi:hypothetical protein